MNEEEEVKEELIKATIQDKLQQDAMQHHFYPQPFSPTIINNCPYCHKPFNPKKERVNTNLLSEAEQKIISDLKELVARKKQFLENVSEIASSRI